MRHHWGQKAVKHSLDYSYENLTLSLSLSSSSFHYTALPPLIAPAASSLTLEEDNNPLKSVAIPPTAAQAPSRLSRRASQPALWVRARYLHLHLHRRAELTRDAATSHWAAQFSAPSALRGTNALSWVRGSVLCVHRCHTWIVNVACPDVITTQSLIVLLVD